MLDSFVDKISHPSLDITSIRLDIVTVVKASVDGAFSVIESEDIKLMM